MRHACNRKEWKGAVGSKNSRKRCVFCPLLLLVSAKKALFMFDVARAFSFYNWLTGNSGTTQKGYYLRAVLRQRRRGWLFWQWFLLTFRLSINVSSVTTANHCNHATSPQRSIKCLHSLRIARSKWLDWPCCKDQPYACVCAAKSLYCSNSKNKTHE